MAAVEGIAKANRSYDPRALGFMYRHAVQREDVFMLVTAAGTRIAEVRL